MDEYPSAPIIHSYLYTPTIAESKYREIMQEKNCFEKLI